MKFPAILQNRQSLHASPASLRFDIHYARLGVIARWDWQRYVRLAAFLNLTVYELGSLICLPHSRVTLTQKKNKFPGPAALLLTLLEAQAVAKMGDVIENPFPL